jgi:V8-like Glu-specific endopeptidase
MRKALSHWFIGAFLLSSAFAGQAFAITASENAKTATVFVAKFDARGTFIGWGSGFYVDEGIVVTNKHVVDGGKYFKVYPAEADNTINLDCGTQLGLSDVKVNLDDDAAYIRAYLTCPHGKVQFADRDPQVGESVTVLGYPSNSEVNEKLHLTSVSGKVTGTVSQGWFSTDAYLHPGNSGGPVISNGKVLGVAVAKSTDGEGNYIEGYFVPTSVILRGLLYANNSTFAYTPQDRQTWPVFDPEPVSSSSSSSQSSLSFSSSSSFSSQSSSSSVSSYRVLTLPKESPLQQRTCARVRRLFPGNLVHN